MKFLLSTLLLTFFCLIYSEPTPPVFPTKYLMVGSFWTLTKEGSVKGYGKFNTKYDWDTGAERSDSFIAPEADYNTSYIVVWKNKNGGLLAFLDEEKGSINCSKLSKSGGIFPPDILKKTCNFVGIDIFNTETNKWECTIESINFILWTNIHNHTPLKMVINYKTGTTVIVEVNNFHKVESFASDVFLPPTGWSCPHV